MLSKEIETQLLVLNSLREKSKQAKNNAELAEVVEEVFANSKGAEQYAMKVLLSDLRGIKFQPDYFDVYQPKLYITIVIVMVSISGLEPDHLFNLLRSQSN